METVFAQSAAGGERHAIYASPYRDTQIALEPGDETAVLCAARRLFRLSLSTGKITPIPFQARFEAPAQSRGDLVITHAHLISGTTAPVVENATIEIHDGRFKGIHSGDGFVVPAGVPVIDAAGKTVMPGLMDNHYHFVDPFLGTALLSRGITSIRDPGGHLSDSMSYKEAIHLGLLNGPDIYAAGPLIDGSGDYHPWVAVEIDDPAKAAALVDSLKEQGVDLLKVYFLLKPEVLCAVIAEAHKQGLKVTGHIGVRTGWSQAIGCGIDGLNHVRVWADLLPLADQPQGENDTLDDKTHPIARMQADWSKIDPNGPAAGALIASMAKAQVGFDPTLSIQIVDDDMRKELSLEHFSLARDAYARMGAFVARAVRAGVPLLAGTDNGSLFDEMEAYESAGIPRPAILEAATSNGARWLGRQADFGSIEPGQRADLIIIDGDPLKQIKDLRNIRTVVKDGRIVFEK
ncbi:MAG: amidohydrolase family protein [Steroidobacteraceae bacterium]